MSNRQALALIATDRGGVRVQGDQYCCAKSDLLSNRIVGYALDER